MDFPSLNEAILEGGDNVWKERFETVDKDFGGKFIQGITEADRSEIADKDRIFSFGDKGDKGVVDFFEDIASIEKS